MTNPRIVFCTTCKGRTEHLAKTLPHNLHDNADYANCKFVVLDYGDPGELAAYLWGNHARDIESGRLVVYRHDAPGAFHVSHAKNMAARCGMLERADILVTLDADNYAGPGFARTIAEQFEPEANFPGVFLCPNFPLIQSLPHGPLRPQRGFAGRLAIRAHDFLKLGGYDESYDTWRGEDIDLIARLQRLGWGMRHIDNRFLGVIPHGSEVRFAEYPHAKQYENKGEWQAIHARTATVVNWGKIGLGRVYRNFGSEPIELGPLPTRIFGIGLHKTGTTSLHAAFQILKFSSLHWGTGEAPRIWQEMSFSGKSPTMERWYAFSDLPFPLLYRELDKSYPGSKFILTVRSEDKWLKSVERLWDPKYNPTRHVWDKWPFSNHIHTVLYGQQTFDANVFLRRYRRHNAEVREYFRGREQDLLVMEAGDGWSKIGEFLGMPAPETPYPVHNQTVAPREEQVCVSTEDVIEIEQYREFVQTCPNYSQEDHMPMPNHNTVNNWGAFLTVVDPSTQLCTFPFPFFDSAGNRLSPFVADPILTLPNGFMEHLNPENWANEACAHFVAKILGGSVSTVAPPNAPQITEKGYVYGQKHYWIWNTNGTWLDPADLVQEFIHVGNKAALEAAIPAMLGIAAQS